MDTVQIDELDARILDLLRDHPRAGLVEIARQAGVARATVQARLDRLTRAAALTGFGPEMEPARMGYPILAFVFLEITQGRLEEAVELLRNVPEVLEADATSGPQDLICRVVARDTEHLQEIVNRMVGTPAVRRSTSHIVLSRQIPMRTSPLVRAAAAEAPASRRWGKRPLENT